MIRWFRTDVDSLNSTQYNDYYFGKCEQLYCLDLVNFAPGGDALPKRKLTSSVSRGDLDPQPGEVTAITRRPTYCGYVRRQVWLQEKVSANLGQDTPDLRATPFHNSRLSSHLSPVCLHNGVRSVHTALNTRWAETDPAPYWANATSKEISWST